MVYVNGDDVQFIEGETLASLVARCGYSGNRIAVEVNRRIIPRAEHGSYVVRRDDRIEIVGLIGGG